MLCIIRPIISHENQKEQKTLIFAAQELQKYLSTVSDGDFFDYSDEKVGL